jgi:hypothetical protein
MPGENQEHRQLFYMLFGELLYSIVNDLTNSHPINSSQPQALQHRSNLTAAEHLTAHIPKFLRNLTELFFNGSCHRSLVAQLERKRHRTPILPKNDYDVTEIVDFLQVSDNLLHVLFALRDTASDEDTRWMPGSWHHLAVSSTILRTQIVDMVKNAKTALPEHERGRQVDHRPFQTKTLEHRHEVMKSLSSTDDVQVDPDNSNNITVNHTEKEHIITQDHVSSGTQVHDGLKKAFLTFTPFVVVFNKIQKYFESCNQFTGRRTAKELGLQLDQKTKTLFFENRMLVMKICEEQMHIVERHMNTGADYQSSLAWQTLFLVFCQLRQKFAEMNIE